MKILWITLFLFSLNSLALDIVVKFSNTVPKSVLNSNSWSRLAPTSKGRLKKVYVYHSSEKDFTKIKSKLSKKYRTEYIEEFTKISAMAIEESNLGTFVVNDPLFKFQWGNQFNGQVVTNEITDLKDIKIPGTSKADIGLSDYDGVEKLFSPKTKEIVIAVLDTGVDFNHPDLKDNIAIKVDECENGEIPFEPTPVEGDLYPGDCKGWNFTGKKEGGTNRPEDFVGHGTHIAGIISAVTNNGIGISGVSNKIKILPIKILSNEPEADQAVGTSERLVKGLEYAISREVDVINLSLGWPISFDKGHLKDSVMDALDQGITIVAAAGNNDHSEPIMPCAYEGVICVGSNDPNSKMSDFTNFGAHVDVLAPGNNIMSTYPTAITPLFADQNGFEIKSGTSQATPYTSLLAGILKAIDPDISEEDIKGKIYGSTEGYQEKVKFSNGHNINFDRAIKQSKGFYRPSFKGFNRVKVDKKDLSFSFDIKIKSYLGAKDGFSFEVKSLNGLIIQSQEFKSLDSVNSLITVTGKFKNDLQKLLQKFDLKLNYKGEESHFAFEKRFYLDFDQVEGVRSFKITGAPPKSLTEFATVNYYHTKYTSPYYYIAMKNSRGMLYLLFQQQSNELKRVGVTVIEGAIDTLSLHILDSNNDGEPDVLIRSLLREEVEGEDPKDSVIYSYLNTNLKPLYDKKLSTIKLKFENTILSNLNNFSFYRSSNPAYGSILIPVYLNFLNQKPEADRNPNPFARLRNRAFSNRIYYYSLDIQDEQVEFITRTLNTNRFSDQLKRKIGFRPFQQIFISKFKQQSLDDIVNGRFSFYLSLESERALPKNFIVNIESIEKLKWNVQQIEGPQMNYSNVSFTNAINLTSEIPVRHQYDLSTLAYEKISKLSFDELFINVDENDFISLEQDDIFNPLEVPLKTYFSSEGIYRFFLTPSKIFLDFQNDKEKKQITYPAHVSSFLPGALFREQHFPISIEGKSGKLPAFYVDATQIASRNIYLITYLNDQIIAPLRFNMNIPENCKALNPIVTDSKQFEYSLQCFEKDGNSEIKFIPLNL